LVEDLEWIIQYAVLSDFVRWFSNRSLRSDRRVYRRDVFYSHKC